MIQYVPIVGDLIGKWLGNRAKRDQYQADARSAVYSQFAAEFGHSKTWWDSLIDGLNRLPRPIMTFGVIYLFVWCARDPAAFIEYAVALQAMPKEGWYILGAVVTFWFAAKLPKDFGKYKIQANLPDMYKSLSASSKSRKRAGEYSVNEKGQDPQEGIEWEERVSKRYDHQDNDRYN